MLDLSKLRIGTESLIFGVLSAVVTSLYNQLQVGGNALSWQSLGSATLIAVVTFLANYLTSKSRLYQNVPGTVAVPAPATPGDSARG